MCELLKCASYLNVCELPKSASYLNVRVNQICEVRVTSYEL